MYYYHQSNLCPASLTLFIYIHCNYITSLIFSFPFNNFNVTLTILILLREKVCLAISNRVLLVLRFCVVFVFPFPRLKMMLDAFLLDYCRCSCTLLDDLSKLGNSRDYSYRKRSLTSIYRGKCRNNHLVN